MLFSGPSINNVNQAIFIHLTVKQITLISFFSSKISLHNSVVIELLV